MNGLDMLVEKEYDVDDYDEEEREEEEEEEEEVKQMITVINVHKMHTSHTRSRAYGEYIATTNILASGSCGTQGRDHWHVVQP